ncbi:TetR/AcrR family transcriptional regulator [Anaeromyxobacter terrae]|uniref:TetR/AcrR family transcriptional regulator n=1 Tax=Anaeromyxobacter terrae TaxID=2925406 RepID=UPI001F56D9A5|nr:helix-turn-helix domain-containing protein [Anaeromyxobacter sp. SG22]
MAAAIALADAEGLEAVSMERVAERLGFTTMSLYRHVPGKAELVALMIEAAIGEPPALAAPERWRSALEEWAANLLGTFQRHPWALTATGRLRLMGPYELGWLETGLSALSATPLDPAERHAACLAVLAQVRSIAQFSLAPPKGSPGLTGERWNAETRALLRVRAERFPELTAALDALRLRDRPPAPGSGLGFVLDGIARRVAQRGARAPAGRPRR